MTYIFVLVSVLFISSQATPVKWRLVTLPSRPYLRGFDTFVPTVALIPSFDTIAAWLRNQSESEEFGNEIWDGVRWNETVQAILGALDGGKVNEELVSEVLEEVQDFSTGNSIQNSVDTEDGEEEELEGNFDFSPLVQLCDLVPPECTSCNLSLIICSICCPSLFPAMLASPSNMTAYFESWVTASLWWTGLEPVLQQPEAASVLHYIVPAEVLQPPRQGLDDNLGQESSLMSNNIQIVHSNNLATQLPLGDNTSVHQVCGYHTFRGERIVGGEEVKSLGHFPWQLSLATGRLRIFYRHRCGAAVISRHWAISAVHCLRGGGVRGRLFVLGEFLKVADNMQAQIRKVTRIVRHPDFVARTYQWDLSLLQLEQPFIFSPTMLPVCLPPPDSLSFEGEMATLAGWGKLDRFGSIASELRLIKLPIISNLECETRYNRSGSPQYVPEESFLCAGNDEAGQDMCNGDSGGPLVTYRHDGRAQLVGVVSWSVGCAAKDRPGVYTRVSRLIDWIEEVVGSPSSEWQ